MALDAERADRFKRLREQTGLSQSELADTLNAALDRNYRSQTVSAWENGKRSIPDGPFSFVEALLLDKAFEADDPVVGSGVPGSSGDTAPLGPGQGGAVPFSSSGAYKRACTELWEIIAAGVGIFGAAVGSQKLMNDGAIIAADKDALGDAWGKLAETNETFRNMLVGMTSGGAWLQVCVVTGTTVGRLWQNHATPPPEGLYVPDYPPDDEAAA